MAKLTEPSADEIAAAAEQRDNKVQREILTLYIESLEELDARSDEGLIRQIEACRSLLKELEQSPCGPPAGTTIH